MTKTSRWLDSAVAVAIVTLVVVARSPGIIWALPANGTCGSVPCGSGFDGSWHDFVDGPAGLLGVFEVVNGIPVPVGQCTLCHTPHVALQTALLWNHHLSNNSQFTWEANATTMAGTSYATIANTWTGPTAKCLSCHDGSVNAVTINWFEGVTPPAFPNNETCTTTNGVTTCQGPQQPVNVIVGYAGSMMHSHPSAMPYPCTGTRSTYNGVTTGAAIVGTEWVGKPVLPIRLYQETNGVVSRSPSAGCVAGSAGVECTSCHDVHNRENIDVNLLRGYISGGGSNYICNECHSK